MISALQEFIASERALASGAIKCDKSGPYFPINVLPLDQLLSIHELDESVQIEEPVNYMLGDHLPVEVDEYLCV